MTEKTNYNILRMTNLLTVLKCFSFFFFFFFFFHLLCFSSLVCSVSVFVFCFFHLSIFRVSFVLFPSCIFFLFPDSFQLFITNFLDVLISFFCFQSSLGFLSFYRPLPWSSRFKLRFEIMPCGHKLAFSTKYTNMLYTHNHNHNTKFNERTKHTSL